MREVFNCLSFSPRKTASGFQILRFAQDDNVPSRHSEER